MLVDWLGKATFVALTDTLVLITVLLPSVLGLRRQPQPVGMPQRSTTLFPMRNLDLLLENWWRTADLSPLQSNIYLHAIGDSDERNAARHAIVFAIKSHGAVETAGG